MAQASQRELALRLLPLLDLTSLGEDDRPAQIEALCAAARSASVHAWPAALCVYPEHVTTVRRALHDGRAIAAGADEIDMVLPYRALLRGEALLAEAAVMACREACGSGIALKLILETGELAEAALIRQACAIGLRAQVDFLKTSTGKVKVNATPEAAALMLDAIADDGGRCGFKAAGGIRTLDDAQRYLALAEERLGAGWVTPAHFRIGASALFTEIGAALASA